ncbi:hypothetical protein ADT71_00315 [Novosphingobium sp. ST904]|nr:hypothetical protein ADT71_00315 [Novosphingobium sp. ST904]
MRHDPASAAVVVMLRGLKMFGMAQAAGDLIEQGAPAFDASVPMLSQLLKAEMAEREVRSISYQIKAARFPAWPSRPEAAILVILENTSGTGWLLLTIAHARNDVPLR